MTTIAIVSQKGGSGKTTLALHIAASAVYAGNQVQVIDTDPQATAAAWGDWRGEFLPEVITCPPVRLFSTVERAKRAGSNVIVIDTPPHGDTASREAVRVADIVLVPTRARASICMRWRPRRGSWPMPPSRPTSSSTPFPRARPGCLRKRPRRRVTWGFRSVPITLANARLSPQRGKRRSCT